MSLRNFFFLLFFITLYAPFAQDHVYNELVDSRDGTRYKIITIKHELDGGVFVERTWMAQNLNYEVDESFCYKNEIAYCRQDYGRLYTFKGAMQACPRGWHIPTLDEWGLLFKTYGGVRVAGTALQSGGESGLNLMFGGFGDPSDVFKNIGTSGNYWDSARRSANTSGVVSIQKDSKEIHLSAIGNWHRNSCRCIQDYE